jgi:hypothetical protein
LGKRRWVFEDILEVASGVKRQLVVMGSRVRRFRIVSTEVDRSCCWLPFPVIMCSRSVVGA